LTLTEKLQSDFVAVTETLSSDKYVTSLPPWVKRCRMGAVGVPARSTKSAGRIWQVVMSAVRPQGGSLQRVGLRAGRVGGLPVSTSAQPRLLAVLSLCVRRRRGVRAGALAAPRPGLALPRPAARRRLRRPRPLRRRRTMRGEKPDNDYSDDDDDDDDGILVESSLDIL